MENNYSKMIVTNAALEASGPKAAGDTGKVNLSIDLPKEDFVLCKVCGHKNKKGTGVCEMCSNYLFI